MENITIVDPGQIDHSKYTFIGVESVILDQQGNILLQQRGATWSRFPNYLTNFGGALEAGETATQAIIRELNEELGAVVLPTELRCLGAVTEAATNHQELIYVYFWQDHHNTITGCYEGTLAKFPNIDQVLAEKQVMDSTRWALNYYKTNHII